MELFKLLGTIAINNSEANRALKETSSAAKDTADDISGAASSSKNSGSKWGSAFKKIGSGALALGKTVATGLAVGATALGGLTVKALSTAGELEQNMGGSEAVFKEYAASIQETAKSAFSNMGLSTSDYLATANKMGALFQGAGFDIKESMTISQDAMQRAADVASIMGIDTASAMEAIAGAAKGNFTMMDNLGVAMNDTTLQAYALEKGISKSTQEMTNQEKIGLAMEMFMEKTAYAAGNYAKENETLAGSLGTAKAALSNFLSGSGTVEDVVTSFSNAAKVIVKNITEIFPSLMTGITQIVQQIVPMIPPLLEQLLPGLIEGATGLINGIVNAMPQIISALMAALPALINGVVQIVNALIEALPSIIQTLVAALPTLLPALIDGLVSIIIALCSNFAQIIQPIIDYLPEIIVSIVNALMNNLPALIVGVGQLIIGLAQAIPQLWTALDEGVTSALLNMIGKLGEWLAPIFEVVSTFFSGVVDWLNTNVIQPVGNFFQGLWEGIKIVWDGICNAVSIAVQLIASILDAAFQLITLPFRFIWENCKEYVFAAWEWIKEKVSTAINAVKTVITNVMNAISNFLSPILNTIKTTFSTVWENIKSAVSNAINAVKTTVTNVFNSVKDTVSNIWNGVKTTISNVVNNIKDTISNVFNSVKTTVGNIFDSIKEKMSTPIEKARDTIKGIVDKIKGFFSGMNISFPSIKLPHFGISPSGWKIGDLLKGSIPKLSIDWYAKAMDNPIVMTKPTIWGYDPETGNLKGGGEAGSEVVTGTNTLMRMIQSAVAAQNDAIVYYLNKIIEILAAYFPQLIEALGFEIRLDSGELVGRLAPAMNEALGKISTRKDRGR